ncbi:MAG: hypothetical protein HN683_04745 [Gammaproteobacteria bacterium]|nr:hypothetical protein [Gammaproteobacteria bacterium]
MSIQINDGYEFKAVKPLHERVMLVKKSTKRQRQSMPDKQAREQLARDTGTDAATWNVSKKMFTRSKLFKAANTALNTFDKYVTDHTSASLDDGFRTLPSVDYIPFTQAVKPLIQDVDDAAANFSAAYESEVINDMRWNTQFSRADYPAFPPEISASLSFRPIASSDVFYDTVDDVARAAYEDHLDQVEEAGKQEVIRRVLKPLEQTVARLETYTGDKGQRWHQDVVENAYEMLDTLESLVTDGDSTIMQLLADVRTTLQPYCDNDKLRDSQLARDNAKQDMESILSKFQ